MGGPLAPAHSFRESFVLSFGDKPVDASETEVEVASVPLGTEDCVVFAKLNITNPTSIAVKITCRLVVGTEVDKTVLPSVKEAMRSFTLIVGKSAGRAADLPGKTSAPTSARIVVTCTPSSRIDISNLVIASIAVPPGLMVQHRT